MSQDLAIRNTHTYVGTCSDLDSWTSIGSYDVLTSGSEIVDEEDPCEPTRIYLVVRVHSDHPKIEQALKSSLASAGCAHEYDCCGCWSHYVHNVTHIHTDLWFVQQHASRNY